MTKDVRHIGNGILRVYFFSRVALKLKGTLRNIEGQEMSGLARTQTGGWKQTRHLGTAPGTDSHTATDVFRCSRVPRDTRIDTKGKENCLTCWR